MAMKIDKRPQVTFAEAGRLKGSWVASSEYDAQDRNQLLCTQLQFNRNVPAAPVNLMTQFRNPAPIVIEKLGPLGAVVSRGAGGGSLSSSHDSLRFSVVSEERLQQAVRLAQRDLRRRHRESLQSPSTALSPGPSPAGRAPQSRNAKEQHEGKRGQERKASTPKAEVTKSGARMLVYTPERLSRPPRTEEGLSPPTRDSGPVVASKEPPLSQEIHRLQRELGTYVQRIEQLANRGLPVGGPVDPEEQRRVKIHRQEQAARSARIIYVLQQQVKAIQEDLDKLRSQKIKHTKKSTAMGRLAAAHRGAVRALQVFVSQLPDQSEDPVPSHYKELGHLIRQLSLCTARVEAGQGSSVPETAIDILHKLEALDSALSKQDSPSRGGARTRSSSPTEFRAPRGRRHSTSPPRGPRPPATRGRRIKGPRKPTVAKKILPDRKPPAVAPCRTDDPPTPERSEVLKAGLETLIRMGALSEGTPGPSQPPALAKHKGVLLPARLKGSRQPQEQGPPLRDTGFQQPTLSSRLKENQPPQKDAPTPWIPPNPTSPRASPPRRALPKKQGAQVLFSPSNMPAGPSAQRETLGDGLEPDRRQQAHREALRQAWLDEETTRRLRQLGQIAAEEAERIQRLRAEAESPTRWAERAEAAARDRLRPLLDRAQQISDSWERKGSSLRHRLSVQAANRTAGSAELLSEAILDDLLDDTARALWAQEQDRQADSTARSALQGPTLESMLLRMEEMEKDQDAMRRRFAQVVYSDPEIWAKEERAEAHGSPAEYQPTSPRPFRVTRPLLRQEPSVDIVLEPPMETSAVSEISSVEDPSRWIQHPRLAQSQATEQGGTVLSLPMGMQKNIRQNTERYEAYLRLVSHEALGNFNPWAIADSLAEELMSEVLADVTAEFQDMCEEYAEAVFTSEFLQPIESPTGLPPGTSQPIQTFTS
ncbi:protein moonraker [Amia ocellicauda]|uniref:protein moonraker n=1 Tax=Amia ocellicauda TaxID=2972642 RepID=UPI00346386A1